MKFIIDLLAEGIVDQIEVEVHDALRSNIPDDFHELPGVLDLLVVG